MKLDYTFSYVSSMKADEESGALIPSSSRSMDISGGPSVLRGWPSSGLYSGHQIHHKLPRWRAGSRDIARTADHGIKYLGLVENNIIGPKGVRIIPETRLPDGSLNGPLNELLSALYKEQSHPESWSVTGRLSRAMFTRLCTRRVAVDGEVLIRFHESADDFLVELIDAERLDSNRNDVDTYMGVKEDSLGRPVGYWILPRRHTFRQSGSLRSEFVPADDIIHVFYHEEADQARGIPWLSTPAFRLKMLSGYEDAAVTAARGAAVKTGAYMQTEEALDGARPSGTLDQESGRISQFMSPGENEIVPYGWKLETLDWGWPNLEHGAFVESQLRGAAAGLQVDYYDLSGNLRGASYSSLRHSALSSRDDWQKKQDWWISSAERRLYERRMSWLLASGRVRELVEPLLPPGVGIGDPHLLCARYVGRRWPWVDPRHDITAEREAMEANLRAPSDVIRERGEEPGEVWRQIQEDLSRMRILGISSDEVENE